MIIRQQVVRASEKRATDRGTRPAAMPAAGSERLASAGTPALKLEPALAPRVSNAELSQRRANLSFAGASPSPTEFERTIGTNDLVDEFYLERALAAAKPVCRVIVRNEASREVGYATGFLVSPRLLLTNWHVFRTAEEANNGIAEFDFTLDVSGNPVASSRFLTKPDQFYYSNQELDFALVAVSNVSLDSAKQLSTYGHHSLVPTTGKINEGEWITIIQYPGGQRRQYAIRENQLLEKQANFLWYKSDTAPGSSGAPAFNDSFQVVGLHHSGKAKRDGDKYVLKDGSRVDSLDGVDDSDVVWESNEGVRVSVMCDHIVNHLNQNDPYMQELRSSMQDGGISAQVISKKIPVNGHEALTTRDQGTTLADPSGLVLPLQSQVSLA